MTPHPPRHREAHPAVPLLGLLLLSACGSGGEPPEGPGPAFPTFDAMTQREDSAAADEDRSGELLVEADIHFSEGRYRTASSLFERYLDEAGGSDGGPAEEDRALWGLAMLHLVPESPLYDREEALLVLDELVEAHPETSHGIQARWVRGLLEELDRIRTQAEQQEALLLQLTETVEQLRTIDLNRRPTGSGDTVTGGDTIPPRPGGPGPR